MKKLLALLPAFLVACADSPTAPAPSPAPLMIATASASGGAVVVHDRVQDSYCYDYPEYNARYCSTVDGQLHSTETPSGNTNFVWHADYTSDYHETFGGITYSYSNQSSTKQHFVFKPGEDQVMSWQDKGTYSSTANGQTVNCTYTYRYHYANGEVRIADYDVTCSDPTPA